MSAPAKAARRPGVRGRDPMRRLAAANPDRVAEHEERARAAVVHLELHTADQARASAFYARLCGWRPERIDTDHGSYQRLALVGDMSGGSPAGGEIAFWQPKL